MPTDSNTPTDDQARLRKAFLSVLLFVVLLWTIKAFEFALGLDLVQYGVFPRQINAFAGILWSPLIHGSWSHLFANTPAILVLGTAILFGYPRAARVLLPSVYLGAGLGVWLFARPAFHIGASGLTFGIMFFVFTIGILRWDRRAIALAMIVFFLYGSMIWGIFPNDLSISFETHFFGAAIGVVLAVLLRSLDPPPPRKSYSWEDEDDETSVDEFDESIGEDTANPDEHEMPQRPLPGTSPPISSRPTAVFRIINRRVYFRAE